MNGYEFREDSQQMDFRNDPKVRCEIRTMTENRPHEWIEVLDRRWCVGCDLFQKRAGGNTWKPIDENCSRHTPYARQIDYFERRSGGGPTVNDPDRLCCNPDQSCCDFACGN